MSKQPDNATPRPWRVGCDGNTIYRKFLPLFHAASKSHSPNETDGKENAELIVRAVNEHAALLAVVEAAKKLDPIIDEHRQASLNGNNSALLDVTIKRVKVEKQISTALANLKAIQKGEK